MYRVIGLVSLAFVISASLMGDARSQDAFAAVFRAAGDGRTLVTASNWNQFSTAVTTASGQGLRLIDLSVNPGGDRMFVGVFQPGTDTSHLLAQYANWDVLAAAAEYHKTQRLVDIETWKQGNATYFAGVWREGTGSQVLHKADSFDAFKAKWEEQSAAGMRLTRVASWVQNGIRRYGALYRPGTGAHFLWAGDWTSFSEKLASNNAAGLSLIDLETYEDPTGRQYLGIWGPGNGGQYLWIGNDFEHLRGLSFVLAQSNIRLVDLESFPGCNAECGNQVVVGGEGAYGYGFPGGSFAQSPVTFDGTEKYPRLAALEFSEQPFFLPFSDRDVTLAFGWLYGENRWHHAYDYWRPSDRKTFDVRAAAAGHVIETGWDWWSGNFVVVGHDVGGVTNRFVTYYLHLRNGPGHDCTNSWVTQKQLEQDGNATPETDDTRRTKAFAAQYKAYLEDTGCTEDVNQRNLEEDYWGTDQQIIPANLAGQNVNAGTHIGWAGQTGPGGQNAIGMPNTHLHIFWSHLDPNTGGQFFIDPHGIYGRDSQCYPATITDAGGGWCRRYPIAWSGGHPQYPPGF